MFIPEYRIHWNLFQNWTGSKLWNRNSKNLSRYVASALFAYKHYWLCIVPSVTSAQSKQPLHTCCRTCAWYIRRLLIWLFSWLETDIWHVEEKRRALKKKSLLLLERFFALVRIRLILLDIFIERVFCEEKVPLIEQRQCLVHRPGFQHLIAASPTAAVVFFCCSIYCLSGWHHCPNPNSNNKILEKKKEYEA